MCTATARKEFSPTFTTNAAVVVLTTLALDGPQRPSRLQHATRLTSAGLSHLLDRFAAAGVITRSERGLEHDQRAVVARLTPEGRRTEKRLVTAIVAGLREASPNVKELLVTLEDLGSRPPADPVGGLPPRAASRTARALGQLGIALVEALQLFEPGDGPLDPSAALALMLVAEEGEARPVHLADVLLLTSGGVTRLLDRLEDAGFVERHLGSVRTDRRAVVVSLTEAGTAQLDAALERASGRLDDLLAAVVQVLALLPLEAPGQPSDPSRRRR